MEHKALQLSHNVPNPTGWYLLLTLLPLPKLVRATKQAIVLK